MQARNKLERKMFNQNRGLLDCKFEIISKKNVCRKKIKRMAKSKSACLDERYFKFSVDNDLNGELFP